MLFWDAAKLREWLVALPVTPHAVTILEQPIGDGRGDLPCDWSVYIGAEHPCMARTPAADSHPPCPNGLHYDEADITHCVTEQCIAAGQQGARTYRLSAYAHRQVLGWVKYQHHTDRLEIDFIEVGWDYRRQGVATGLLDELQRRRPGLPLTTGGFTEEGQRFAAAYPTPIQDEYPWRQQHRQA
jgi:hypothetical protein